MAEPKLNFTPAQQCAIGSRGSTVLVSAAAGSGKTRVLTERLMAWLTDAEQPVDLDRFLIITYTRAAASELRARILDSISARIAADPENRRLRRQSALCARAQIGTIHSFCGDILRENCAAVGLAPDFKVADAERTDALKAMALDKLLEHAYASIDEDAAFRLLADTAGAGRDDARLSALILNLYDKMQCHARP
ncbi:MAG: UvrD-helicase domain-containing protein, partial [Clostridiales bacterium]|nr:UvrD-helicase domain-containing protein [Clostridiales bacterium]